MIVYVESALSLEQVGAMSCAIFLKPPIARLYVKLQSLARSPRDMNIKFVPVRGECQW